MCSSAAAASTSSAVPRLWPAKYGQRMSQKSPIASRPRSSSSSVSGGRSIGSASRTSSKVSSSIPSNSASGSVHTAATISGSKCVPLRDRTISTASSTPPMRWNTSHASATCEIRAESASASPARSPGTPFPSHRAYDCSMPARTSARSPKPVGELAGGRAVVGHLLDHPPSAGGHQLRGLADAVERRCSGAGPAQHEHHRREPGQVDLDGVGAEVDVVAEQRRGLVAVDRAPDVGEDAHVVEVGQLGASRAPAGRPAAC